jgi:hypothetical protein
VTDTQERLDALEAAGQDVRDAGKIAALELQPGTEFAVRVELGVVAPS